MATFSNSSGNPTFRFLLGGQATGHDWEAFVPIGMGETHFVRLSDPPLGGWPEANALLLEASDAQDVEGLAGWLVERPPCPVFVRAGDPASRDRALSRWGRGTATVIGPGLDEASVLTLIHSSVAGQSGMAHVEAIHDDLPASWVQDALRESERRFREIVVSMAGWIWETGPDWRLSYVSENTLDYLGMTVDEALGLSFFSVVDLSEAPVLESDFSALAETQAPIRDRQLWIRRPTGDPICLLVSGEPRLDGHGQWQGYRGVGKDITTQKVAEAALKKSNQRLQELDRLKSDFLSTVSHELRTPIAIMGEGVSLCLDEIAGPLNPQQRDLLEDTRQNIERLARLISDLLDVSRIEAGKLLLRRQTLDMVQRAKQALEAFEGAAREQGITLQYEGPERLSLYVDGDKIRQIWDNLLSNALRFTDQGGRITLSLEDQGDGVWGAVSDTGVGIAPADLERLFSKFAQIGRVDGPGYKGTGLGLAIVKGLVEKHGGEVRVDSTVGEGSRFAFTVKRITPPVIALADSDAQGLKAMGDYLKAEGYGVNVCPQALPLCDGLQGDLVATAYAPGFIPWLEAERARDGQRPVVVYSHEPMPASSLEILDGLPRVSVLHGDDVIRLVARIRDVLME